MRMMPLNRLDRWLLGSGLLMAAACVGESTAGRSDELAGIFGDETCDPEIGDLCDPGTDEGAAGDGDADTDADADRDDDEGGECDLPYDIKMPLGSVHAPIADAFAEEGCVPESFTVELDGVEWRAEELLSGAAFEITEADCDHEGNRDAGRDRVNVTWTQPSGETETDHLDLRYCDE